VVASSDGNSSFAWRDRSALAEGTEAHYYLRIRMNSNANIWTGPVYVTRGSLIAVGDPPPASAIALAASPNPTPGRTTASFSLPSAVARGQLVVYDAAGRRVKTLLDGPLTAGAHAIAWTGQSDDGSIARSGVYFIRLLAGEHAVTRKILLIR